MCAWDAQRCQALHDLQNAMLPGVYNAKLRVIHGCRSAQLANKLQLSLSIFALVLSVYSTCVCVCACARAHVRHTKLCVVGCIATHACRSMSVCVYVYVYIYIYMIYVYDVYIYIYVYVYVYVCVHRSMHAIVESDN